MANINAAHKGGRGITGVREPRLKTRGHNAVESVIKRKMRGTEKLVGRIGSLARNKKRGSKFLKGNSNTELKPG